MTIFAKIHIKNSNFWYLLRYVSNNYKKTKNNNHTTYPFVILTVNVLHRWNATGQSFQRIYDLYCFYHITHQI